MAFGNVSPRRQAARRNNLLHLVGGIFIGFCASSFLSTLSMEPPQQTLLKAALHSKSSQIPLRRSEETRLEQVSSSRDERWNTLHVFYGNTSHIVQASQIPAEAFERKQWFSQLQQDELVSRLLHGKRNGFFVDLAANDAVRISNTYALETHFNWQGLCIEANPMYWSGLAYRPRCTTVAAVVGRSTMDEVNFRFPNRAAPKGGIVGPKFDNKEISHHGEDQLRYTVTLSHVFEKFQVPHIMDYLSLDVEGAEFFVMESFPFDRYRFRLLTIERPDDKLCRLLMQNGYSLLKQLKNWGETIWMHTEFAGEMNMSALTMDTENYIYSEKV